VTFLRTFGELLFVALDILILARVVMSWVNPRFDGTLGRFVYETTEPLLAPIRRLLPGTGMLDFSPIIAFMLVGLVAAALGLR
jgi:YggT family protein